MNLHELKKQREEKQTEIFAKNKIFWAFSNEQFAKNKTPLNEGEKYVSIGAGGYLPKGNLDSFLSDMENLNKWFKDQVKENKLREKQISYELANHEAYYTGDIEDTMLALGEDFTADEVWAVYNKTYKEWAACNAG